MINSATIKLFWKKAYLIALLFVFSFILKVKIYNIDGKILISLDSIDFK